MSAEDLGKRLIAEVEEGSLTELLSSLRVRCQSTAQYTLGVQPLDRLLGLFSNERTSYHSTDRHNATKPPPFIELTSPGSGDGKSQFLYHLIAISVLPPTLSSVDLGGQNSIIVLLDTDSRFSAPRLATVLHNHISTCASNAKATQQPTSEAISKQVLDALHAVHVFTPQSLTSLIATVNSLSAYLFTLPTAQKGKKVASLVLDSASAFFWAERADTEDAAAAAAATTATSSSDAIRKSQQERSYHALLYSLRSASMELQTPVVYTTWNLSSSSSSSRANTGASASAAAAAAAAAAPRPHIWPTLPTLRLSIVRKQVRKFPVGTSAQEALRDRAARVEVLRQGIFEVEVCGFGAEGWSERVLRGVRGEGGFRVLIRGEGVGVRE